MSHSFLVRPQRRPLLGEVRVPGDKSISHRAVLLAALGQGQSVLRGLSGGQDNQRTAAAFAALGVQMSPGAAPGELVVQGQGLRGLRAPAGPLYCGNSGTTMRLLAGVLAAQPFASVLTGDPYLSARPMRRVADPLGQMGGRITGHKGRREGEVYPPLQIEPAPGPVRGIAYRSPIASAQVKSALLLCGLWAQGPTQVTESVRSRDHTERMLRYLGAPLRVFEEADGAAACVLDPDGWQRDLPPLSLEVPGDLSSAAFLMGAAVLVPGSEVVLRGIGLNRTRAGVLDCLEALSPGAAAVLALREEAGEEVGEVLVRGRGALRPVRIGGALAVRSLDELPLLAALAGAGEGDTEITGAAELRVKESDRIAATCALLRAFGVECEELPDGMRVRGRGVGGLRGGAQVDSHGDHRIAMAAAVLALVAPGETLVTDVDNVATSFPGFVAALGGLGADLEVRGG